MTAPRVNLNDWRVQTFIDWLTTPVDKREPSSQGALAEQLGMDRSDLGSWKKDPEFLKEWHKRFLATVGGPDRRQRVLDALYRTATDETDPRQVPAARAYLDGINALAPKEAPPMAVGLAKKLTNEQLEEILRDRIVEELQTDG